MFLFLFRSPQCVEMTYFYGGARYVNAVSFEDNKKKKKEKYIVAYFPSYR